MTATEVLHRLLDERGVKYDTAATVIGGTVATFWHDRDGYPCSAIEGADDIPDGEVSVQACITPEQAIAASLGATDAKPTQVESSGTCKLDGFADVPFSVDYEIEGYDMGSGRDYATLAECSACGACIIVPPEYHHVLTCDGDEVYQPYRFCPICGRRIEQ